MAYLMGIDLGSTSIKAVVYDETGNMIACGSQPTPLTHDNPDQPTWCVWDPKRIWDCVVYASMEATSKIKNVEEIKAVAVTGFGMDGLPMDRDGNPLYPMISWHCPRTIPQYEAFTRRIGAENIFHRTGKRAQAIDTIYRMQWVQENHPEIMDATDKWLLIEDYINYMLCGVKATDYSMATCTSAFDQRTHDWCDDLLREAGISKSIFPKAYQAGRVLGTILPMAARETGLAPGTVVVLGGHDYICAALATGAIDESVLLDITGTWEMLVLATDQISLTDKLYESGYYLEGHVAKGKCCYVGSTVSGDMTEWMRKNLCAEERMIASAQEVDVWTAIIDACHKSPPGSNGCMFLPHFSGAGAPNRNPNSMGAYVGLHNAVRKRDMMRSVMEGLDYQFRMMVESFTENRLGSPQRIIATGGAAYNKFWMQNKADITGHCLEVPELYEATPLGAAMVAGLGIGIYDNEQQAVEAVRRKVTVYEPDHALHEQYNDYYQNIYVHLQDALKDINHAISKRFR